MRFIRTFTLGVSIIAAALAVTASAQDPNTGSQSRFNELIAAAPKAYTAGEIDKAAQLANELLKMAPSFQKEWNYGNAIHVGHVVLGRVALKSGKVDVAKAELLASVDENTMPFGFKPIEVNGEMVETRPKRWKASPQLDTFGPDMSLAAGLISKGDRETVLKYLEMCGKFWELEQGRLGEWRGEVQKGKKPDFGINLDYFFPR